MSSVLPLPLAPIEEYLLLDDRPGHRMTFLVEQTFDGEIDRDAFEIGLPREPHSASRLLEQAV